MGSATASEKLPLVQPRKSRRFVAGALAASLVLAFLAATSARSSGGPRAAFFDYDNDKIFDVRELEYPASQWTGNPCIENCEVVCGARGVSWHTSLDTSHIWESIPAICEHRTTKCVHDKEPTTMCDCVLRLTYPGGPAKVACCSLDGNLDGKVTKKCTKPADCGDHDVCMCACNILTDEEEEEVERDDD